jgi:hypothetical protein
MNVRPKIGHVQVVEPFKVIGALIALDSIGLGWTFSPTILRIHPDCSPYPGLFLGSLR